MVSLPAFWIGLKCVRYAEHADFSRETPVMIRAPRS